MVANIRSRQTQVIIGATDVSDVLVSLEITDSQYDETSGIKKTIGTLTLSIATPTIAIEFDPRLNATLWAKGQTVTVSVADEVGNLQLHPRGALHILRVPKVPAPGDTTMEVSIGCALALNDWRQPAGDASGISPGGSQMRQTLITLLAAAAQLPALQTAIPGTVSGPAAQLGGGYVQQMGELAAAVGYVLFINSAGELRAKLIEPFAAITDTLSVATDCAVYEPGESAEAPIDKVRAYGTIKSWAENPSDAVESRSFVNGSFTFTDENGDTEERGYLPLRVTDSSFDRTPDKTTNIESVQEPIQVVFANKDLLSGLITRSRETNESFYRPNGDRFLIKSVSTLIEPIGVMFPDDFENNAIPSLSRETTIEYTYQNLVVTEIKETVREPIGRLYPDTIFKLIPVTTEVYIQTWQRYGKDGWIKKEERLNYKTRESSNQVTYSKAGSAQPPAPEKAPENFSANFEQVEQIANFPTTNAFSREASYEFRGAQSRAELATIAQLTGQMVQARNYPITLAIDLRDSELANWAPFQTYDIDDGRLVTTAIAVGQSWTITQDQAVTAIDVWGVSYRRSPSIGPSGPGDPLPGEPGYAPDPTEPAAPLWAETFTVSGATPTTDAQGNPIAGGSTTASGILAITGGLVADEFIQTQAAAATGRTRSTTAAIWINSDISVSINRTRGTTASGAILTIVSASAATGRTRSVVSEAQTGGANGVVLQDFTSGTYAQSSQFGGTPPISASNMTDGIHTGTSYAAAASGLGENLSVTFSSRWIMGLRVAGGDGSGYGPIANKLNGRDIEYYDGSVWALLELPSGDSDKRMRNVSDDSGLEDSEFYFEPIQCQGLRIITPISNLVAASELVPLELVITGGSSVAAATITSGTYSQSSQASGTPAISNASMTDLDYGGTSYAVTDFGTDSWLECDFAQAVVFGLRVSGGDCDNWGTISIDLHDCTIQTWDGAAWNNQVIVGTWITDSGGDQVVDVYFPPTTTTKIRLIRFGSGYVGTSTMTPLTPTVT